MDHDEYHHRVVQFLDSGVRRHTLGLAYGRRRIGKSTLLEAVTHARGGFYWEATRAESALQLTRLAEALGDWLGVGRLALDSWAEALTQLLKLGDQQPVPVVLDEFGHVLEADPSVDSVVAAALGPGQRRTNPGQARLVLCGSAVAMLRTLTHGQAPLRGRASLELLMHPHGYRSAAAWLGTGADLSLATRVFAVIGGVIGYATDMVDDDLPEGPDDFDRWVADRVLSPAAPLHHEAVTLLAEDPTLAAASHTMHHSILSAVAHGAVTAGEIAKRLGRSVPRIEPALRRLISAGFVARLDDPLRERRPTYVLADPFLRFHYAVLEPHHVLLRDRRPRQAWDDRLRAVYDARVRGPVFEDLARTWTRQYADPDTLGGDAGHVGPSRVTVDGVSRELDVVVTPAEDTAAPAARSVRALGEAKAGETVGTGRLTGLERARAALGTRAAGATMLLFAPAFTAELRSVAARRPDVALVDLERLYAGS